MQDVDGPKRGFNPVHGNLQGRLVGDIASNSENARPGFAGDPCGLFVQQAIVQVDRGHVSATRSQRANKMLPQYAGRAGDHRNLAAQREGEGISHFRPGGAVEKPFHNIEIQFAIDVVRPFRRHFEQAGVIVKDFGVLPENVGVPDIDRGVHVEGARRVLAAHHIGARRLGDADATIRTLFHQVEIGRAMRGCASDHRRQFGLFEQGHGAANIVFRAQGGCRVQIDQRAVPGASLLFHGCQGVMNGGDFRGCVARHVGRALDQIIRPGGLGDRQDFL